MPLLLRRLAGALSAPLRRSLCTASSRPPWAMVYTLQQGGAGRVSGAVVGRARVLRPRRGPVRLRISVPAHLADGMDFAAASVRATSSDGLLLLDLAETRHCFPAPPHVLESMGSAMLQNMAAAGAATELDVTRFVCNPLRSQQPAVPPPCPGHGCRQDRYGLRLAHSDSVRRLPRPAWSIRGRSAQLPGQAQHAVVRRFLSETGEWDERLPMPCFVPSRMPRWQPIQMHTSHDVLAFGDRLWWFDVTWGAFSVDPFSDRPVCRFIELPRGSVLSDVEIKEKMLLGKRRLMGVSEGKLRYVEVSTEKEPFMIRSFSLDDEGCCWKLTHESTSTVVLPNKIKPQADHLPWIAAIDPFNANIVYFDLGHTVFAMDMAKREVTGSRSVPDSITGLSMYRCAFFLPCLLPTWLESNHIPGAGTLSGKTTDCTRKTLADMLVRVDEDQKK